MDELFHESSRRQLETIARRTPHAVIIPGPIGIGLSGAAAYIAAQLKAMPHTVFPEKNEKIDLENGVISVESIRRLYDLTKTIERKNRIIVIDYAERMGMQAQNAFLKLLEEPSANTMFILLTHDPGKLLPTIRSRAQMTELRPVTRDQSAALLDELKITDERKRTQLLFVAEGLPAELSRLSQDENYFQQRAGIIRDARTFLQGGRYDKMKIIQQYQNDRPRTLLLLKDVMNMLRQAAQGAPKPAVFDQLAQFVAVYERVEANGNIRLQLARSVV